MRKLKYNVNNEKSEAGNQKCKLCNGLDILEISNIAAITILNKFLDDCHDMAELNWYPSQVEMLERLFAAVLTSQRYDEIDMEKFEWEEHT